MLADHGLAADDQRDGVLEIRADRQDRHSRRQSGHDAGRVAARPPEDHGSERGVANDGIVHAPGDRALSPIRNASAMPSQPRERVVILVRDRLAGPVGARHHERLGRAGGEEQMVERRVRQHDAELDVVGRHARRDAIRAGANDNRPRRRRQQLARLLASGAASRRAVATSRDHQREWLLLPELPLAQRRTAAPLRASHAR